ncbi:hypothetical protein MTO96_024207 [Rhipicephalus appendiculatus]
MLVPWSQSPRRLERMRGTPPAIEDLLSSPATRTSSTMLDSQGQGAFPEASVPEETFTEACIPSFTLFVTMLQLWAHWNYLHKYYPERCASIFTIIEEGLWERALFAAFHHENVIHLVSNLVAFFVSAIVLEAALETVCFGVIFTALVALVGLVHTLLVLAIYQHTLEPQLAASCAHTFAGVTVAADILTRTYYGGSKIRYGGYEFKYISLWVLLGEVFILYGVSADNLLPIASGLLVGGFLAKTTVGRIFIRAHSPRRRVNLYVVPNAPVTFLLCAAIVVAQTYGPYLNHTHTAQPTLTFQDPVWQPPILPALYLPNSFHVYCVINSLWKMGQELEQDLGHLRCNARRDPMPWFSVPMPFWVEIILNLAFFSWIMPAGSTVGNVIGVLLGLVVVNVKSENFANCIPGVGSASARSSPRGSTDSEPAALRSHLIGIRRCLLSC